MHAPYLSRFTGLWSGLKIVTAVVDGSMTVALDSTRVEPSFGGLGAARHTPDARVIGRNLLRLEQSQIDDRLPRASEYARANSLNRIVQQGHRDRLGIVAAGKTYGHTKGFGARRVESALAHEVPYSDSAGLQTTTTTELRHQLGQQLTVAINVSQFDVFVSPDDVWQPREFDRYVVVLGSQDGRDRRDCRAILRDQLPFGSADFGVAEWIEERATQKAHGGE